MLDAILFLRMGCSFGSSKPKEKLDPPPGGRSTLERESQLYNLACTITKLHSNI